MNASAQRPLSILLRLRQQQENLAVIALGKAQSHATAIAMRVGRIEQEMAAHTRRLRSALTLTPADATTVRPWHGRLAHVSQGHLAPASCEVSDDSRALEGATEVDAPQNSDVVLKQYRQAAADIALAMADESASLAAAEETLRLRRMEAVAAMNGRKVIDSLQQKLKARLAAEQNLREVKEADEMHAARRHESMSELT